MFLWVIFYIFQFPNHQGSNFVRNFLKCLTPETLPIFLKFFTHFYQISMCAVCLTPTQSPQELNIWPLLAPKLRRMTLRPSYSLAWIFLARLTRSLYGSVTCTCLKMMVKKVRYVVIMPPVLFTDCSLASLKIQFNPKLLGVINI